MNIQNKSSIYTIHDATPPSYSEATGSATCTINVHPEFDQTHMVQPSAPHSYLSNCYPNNTHVQFVYPESAQRQNQEAISRNRIRMREDTNRTNREFTRCCIFLIWGTCAVGISIGIIISIIRNIA